MEGEEWPWWKIGVLLLVVLMGQGYGRGSGIVLYCCVWVEESPFVITTGVLVVSCSYGFVFVVMVRQVDEIVLYCHHSF